LKSKILENLTTLELTAPMDNGTKFGDSHQTTLRIQKTTNHSMLKVEEMLKVKLFGLGNHTRERINNGRFSIL